VPVRIVEILDDEVRVDANHPLAGQTLHYSVSVLNMRDATPEELEHEHPHDGHEHEHDHGEEG
jgi:FKBP-type peptidyl-prolyl cis-trans isomerase SlyD